MTNRRDRMVRRQLYVTQQQSDGIDRIARKTGITASEHYRRAVDLYLAASKKKSEA